MFRSLFLLSLSLILFTSCDNSAPSSNTELDIRFDGFSWTQIALADTLVFDLTSTESGDVYAFTGLEVYVADNELIFEEITSLRGRSGFIAEPDSGWLVSIQDSSIMYTDSPGSPFSEDILSGTSITSSLAKGNMLYLTSSSGGLYSLDLSSGSKDTLYTSGSQERLLLISSVGDNFYMKKGSEIEVLNLNSQSFSESNLPTININQVLSTGEDGALLAATVNQKILISNDQGNSWSEIGPQEIPANVVTDLLFTNSDGFLYTSFLGSGVFLSTDLGNTWVSQTNEELDWNTYAVEWVDGRGLIAATATGIYLREFQN